MDGGPFRVPQPAERRTSTRSEPAYRPPEPVPVEPEAAPRVAPVHRVAKEKKRSKRFGFPLIAVIVIILICIAGFFAWSTLRNANTAIDSSKYQAVFFTNGQVYFGKLQSFNNDNLKLTDIFYLQTQSSTATDSTNPQETSTDQSDVQLIKLGNEIHGPEDQMIISKDQVLFYENLKSDGKVAQSIVKYQKANN